MKTLEEDLLNSNQRHYINYKDTSGETDREMSFCVEDYLKYKKALEIIKKHILSRDMDTSGIYLEFHNGHYEPYYTIEIREGIKQIVSLEEYDLLREVLYGKQTK